MKRAYEPQIEDSHIIAAINALVYKNNSPSKAKVLSKLVRRFFAALPDSELESHRVEDLYGIVLAYWSDLNKSAGGFRLRVFNPTFKADGWDSKHTVIELIQADMPFLVDSIMMALNRMNLNVHFVIHTGKIRLIRSKSSKVTDILPFDAPQSPGERHDSLVYIEIDRQLQGSEAIKEIEKYIIAAISDVKLVVDDFIPIKSRLIEAMNELEKLKKISKIPQKFSESVAFLNWLLDDNFIFLGYNYFQITHDERNKKHRKQISKKLLGILKDQKRYPISKCIFRSNLVTSYHGALDLSISVEKANYLSNVHRNAYMEVITILSYDDKFSVVGEHQLLGLFTSAAYHSSASLIPFLRRKVSHVLDRSKFSPGGHSYKALINVLETFPRDELFQIDENLLFKIARSIVRILERRHVRLFYRKDHYNRYYSCMVYLPKDLYNSALLHKIEKILMNELGGVSVTHAPHFLESTNCRIDYQVRLDLNKPLVEVDIAEVEAKIIAASRNWRDDFSLALNERYDEHIGSVYFREYADFFPISYIDDFSPIEAAEDILFIERLKQRSEGIELYLNHDKTKDNKLKFKLFNFGTPIPLSSVLPILENFGLRVLEERPYKFIINDTDVICLSDFLIELQIESKGVKHVEEVFKEAFYKVWLGVAGNDAFNKLVVASDLTWREVVILRAYTRYNSQTYFSYSEQFIQKILVLYPNIVKMILCLFDLKFNPAYFESQMLASFKESDLVKASHKITLSEHYNSLKEAICLALDGVAQLDHDRILRRFIELIDATLRTNYYQRGTDGQFSDVLSFKFRPSLISNLPRPLPVFEIYVYSKRFEGVHLRGAKVSRGGLRWSNRQDFRTEVLGLMKAQQVKNTVIIPMGAKGGFLPKRLGECTSRDEIQQEGIACYKGFISALLDLTDNRNKGNIVHPKDVVYYDSADPYLVVAADKGTATFSDIANSIALSRGFWLGDAFASGGSNGYDHKKMGITAKGSWESVKRHFLMMGRDIQKQEFTAVGIGDMSGDVFGNGMLLSPHLRLVAAFNHMHIFIDPNPDAKASYQVRKKLFKMPRSSWEDYDPKLISKGGGVFSRSLKYIEITPQIRLALGISEDIKELEPSVLIQCVLKAPVDLLWNGGIGTYAKASLETDAQVDDKLNDVLRVNSSDLRCKVVGEGGNLGFTQSARIEYALNGGFIYTDAIDNSAGVNCSDHEVNIKILLNDVLKAGKLNCDSRNKLLASMEKEVGELVLSNNYQQTQAIDNMLYQDLVVFHSYLRLIHHLEKLGILKRRVEFIPGDKVLKARFNSGLGLTGPEVAVILAYSKIVLKNELIKTGIPNKPYFKSYLYKAFPNILVSKYKKHLDAHYLAKEIVVTQLINEVIQYMGMGFVGRLIDATGATAEQVICAFVISKEIFDVDKLWGDIEALDGKVEAKIQRKMMNMISKLLRRATRWFLRNRSGGLDVEKLIDELKPKVAILSEGLHSLLTDEDIRQQKDYLKILTDVKVPKKLAVKVVNFNFKHPFLDIIEASKGKKFDLCYIASTYYRLSDRLSLAWLRDSILKTPSQGYWDILAGSALRDDIDQLQRILTIDVLEHAKSKNISLDAQIKSWEDHHKYMLLRWDSLIEDLKIVKREFIMYLVAVRSLLDLAKCGL
jgi:glutamate dehydrogenase